jgi:uncharacterized protein (TIGR02996 family)
MRAMGLFSFLRRGPNRKKTAGGRGHVTDLHPATGHGVVTLEDGRILTFRRGDCQGFEPSPFAEVHVSEVEGGRALALTRPVAPPAAPSAPPREPPPDEPENPELERALLADPDDVEAHLVLGDWLQDRGHPRGELIALMHRTEREPHRDPRPLADELRALFVEHRRALLGDLVQGLAPQAIADAVQVKDGGVRLDLADGSLRSGWRLGFLRSVRIADTPARDGTDDGAPLEALLAHPSARLVQELTLGLMRYDDPGDYGEALELLAAAGPRPTLRRLFIGDFEFPDEMEISWTSIGDLSALYPLYPALRELTLQAGDFTLGEIVLPELRSFELRTGGLRRPCVEAICRASWPRLQRLVLWLGDPAYGAEGTIDDVEPILAGEGLPELDMLGLMNTELTDEICNQLPRSAVAGRIRVLDLSMGTMSDDGARALGAGREAFARLERLDVSMNYLTDQGVQALRGLCPSVIVGQQQEGEEGERYVTVGE